MKNLYSILTAIAFIVVGKAFAQTSDVTIQRRCLDQAITTIEDYEAMATIGDDETRYTFLELFTDSAVVFNDLMGVSKRDWMKVEEYVKLLTTGLRNRKVSIKNIRSESVDRDGDTWKVGISFDKSISYLNGCGIYFSSEDVYSKDYRLTANMRYNPQTGQCKIYEISGVANGNGLPSSYVVFEKKAPRDNQLLFRKQEIKFNRYDQAFLEGPVRKEDFVYKDPDVTAKPIMETECNKVSVAYKARKMRLRLHYDFGLGSALSIDIANPLSKNSSSNSLGLELGFIFPSKSKLKTGIFIGAGMTSSKIDLGMNSADYYYETDADVDGDNYIRHYHDLTLTQTAKLSEVNIPLYLDLDYRFSPWTSFYVDLGAKANIVMSRKIDKAEGSAYVDGVYTDYNHLVLNEEWGYNGFGQQTYSLSDNEGDKLDGISKMTFDALLGVGFRFNIPTTSLTFDLGINYRMGITEMTTSDRSSLGLANNSQSPVVYNSISGMSSTEHVRNMTDALQSLKRKALKLTLGIIYKF